MKEKEIIDFNNLSVEEICACVDIVTKMREEQRKKECFEKARTNLREMVISTIDVIGLDETKCIIREINQDLRGR